MRSSQLLKVLTWTSLIGLVSLQSACGGSSSSVPVPPPTSVQNGNSQGGTSSKVQKNPTQGNEPIDGVETAMPLNLEGTWKDCRAKQEGTVVKSFLVSVLFNAGKHTLKSQVFKDEKCTTPLDGVDVEKYLAEAKVDYQKETPPPSQSVLIGILADLRKVAEGAVSPEYSYKVGATLGSGVTEIDFDLNGKTSYLAFKVEGGLLKLTGGCSEEDVAAKHCTTVIGNSASNRSISNFVETYSQ